jgi:hypothetical protein
MTIRPSTASKVSLYGCGDFQIDYRLGSNYLQQANFTSGVR